MEEATALLEEVGSVLLERVALLPEEVSQVEEVSLLEEAW